MIDDTFTHYALLRFCSVKPLFLLVRAHQATGDTREPADAMAFLYNDHTCPTNFIWRDVETVIFDGDGDPHGVFEYQDNVPRESLEAAWNNCGDAREIDVIRKAFGPAMDEVGLLPTFLPTGRTPNSNGEVVTPGSIGPYRTRVSFIGGPKHGEVIELDWPSYDRISCRMTVGHPSDPSRTWTYDGLRSLDGHHLAVCVETTDTLADAVPSLRRP